MTDHTQNALVWCEIPDTDMENSVAFYSEELPTEVGSIIWRNVIPGTA